MIAGLSHLSTAFSAMRVAEAAQARAEQAREQVATGRRVNSAKDDGAAFQVALAAQSDMALWRGRDRLLNKLEGGFELQDTVVSKVKELYVELAGIVLQARDTVAGSTERRALAESYVGIMENLNALINVQTQGVNGTPSTVQPDGRYGIQPWQSDSVMGGRTWALVTDLSAFSQWSNRVDVPNGVLVALRGYDIVNANDTQLQDVQSTARQLAGMNNGGYASGWSTLTHAEFARLRSAQTLVGSMLDRTEAAVGQTVDADMGRVSADLEAAETRAAMAQQGISRAIQLYARQTTAVLDSALSNWSRVRAVA
jgi:flagellin